MRNIVRAVLGIAIGIGLFWLAVRQIDPRQVAPIISRMNWSECGLAVLLYWMGMAIRVVRWRALLTTVKRLSLSDASESLFVGYAVNNILPARLGELFRADFVSRRHEISRSAVLGCVIVERLQDLIIVVLLLNFGIAGLSIDQAHGPLVWLVPLASVGLLCAILSIWALALWHGNLRLSRIPWLGKRIEHLAISVRSAQKQLPKTLVLTTMVWILEASAVFVLLLAFGSTVSLKVLALLHSLASLASVLPSAPGYAGSLQAAYILAFSAYDLPTAPAVVVSVATQLFLLGTVTLAGLIMLVKAQTKPS